MKLHWKIIIGMVAGVLFGLLMSQTSFGSEFIKDWIKPFGTIFINLLKLIAMPLILASLIKGISDLKDISKLSTIGTRTLGVYVCTTVLAVIVGLVLVNIVQPGNSIKEETRIDLVQEYALNKFHLIHVLAADWSYSINADLERDRKMIKEAEILLVIDNSKSNRIKLLINWAEERQIKIFNYKI